MEVRAKGMIDTQYGLQVYDQDNWKILKFVLNYKDFYGKRWCRSEVRCVGDWKVEHYLKVLRAGSWVIVDGYYESYKGREYIREEEIAISVLRGMNGTKKPEIVENRAISDPNQVDYEIDDNQEY